jgi:hypothetical protein
VGLDDGLADGRGVRDGPGEALGDDEGDPDGSPVAVGRGDADGLAVATAATDEPGEDEAEGVPPPRRAKNTATKATARRPTSTSWPAPRCIVDGIGRAGRIRSSRTGVVTGIALRRPVTVAGASAIGLPGAPRSSRAATYVAQLT